MGVSQQKTSWYLVHQVQHTSKGKISVRDIVQRDENTSDDLSRQKETHQRTKAPAVVDVCWSWVCHEGRTQVMEKHSLFFVLFVVDTSRYRCFRFLGFVRLVPSTSYVSSVDPPLSCPNLRFGHLGPPKRSEGPERSEGVRASRPNHFSYTPPETSCVLDTVIPL